MKKVLGLGNALVDILAKLDNDELLSSLNFPKGSMQLVDHTQIGNVLNEASLLKKTQASGGSAANTINGLANLGVETGFLGKVGNDDFGKFFREDMESNNIKPNLFIGDAESGRAVVLVSQDSERTFATYLGAAVELSADDLASAHFEDYSYIHIEGYLVQNQALMNKAVELAKENNLKVSLDLASFNVVEDNLEFLKDFVKNHVDIVFANEEEAKSFTGQEPEEALDTIAENCDIAIVKIGKKGSLIRKGGEKYIINTISAQSIDTTGAGDLYAAGFMYGLVHDMSLDICGKIGTILSGKVIEVIGPKMDDARWADIKSMVSAVKKN